MLTLAEAHAIIVQNLHALESVRMPIEDACGCTLRESVVSPEDVPAFDRSAYDGFAFRSTDAPANLRVAFEVPAGSPPARGVAPGECARIFTGGQIPADADTVAMQEDVTVSAGFARIPAIARGHGVRRRGEDARAGELLIPCGQRLGSVELGMLAQIGHTRPLVSPRVRVFHVVSGSELVPPDAIPAPGQIRDSNGTLTASLAREAGCEIVVQRRVGDRLDALVEALQCVPEGDQNLLLISGGASVGDYDFGRQALEELGFCVKFSQVNLRPGKPLIFAVRGRQAAFVIPGNPLSHLVCWHVGIRVAISMLASGKPSWALETVRLGDRPLRGNPRESWWPARLWNGVAEALKWRSSGDLTGMAGVNALLRVPAGVDGIEPGGSVQALRF